MLTSLSIARFKSWSSIDDLKFGKITGLFGTNSSGKSSILQFILLLKQTKDSPDRSQALNLGDERDPVRFGTFQDVMFDHDTDRSLSWSIAWLSKTPIQVPDVNKPGKTLFTADYFTQSGEVKMQHNKRIQSTNVQYSFYHENEWKKFALKQSDNTSSKYELSANFDGFHFSRPQGRPWDLPAPIKCYGFPDQVRRYYQNAAFLSDFEFQFEELFDRVHYLGPLREQPKREYSWAGASPSDVGRRGENAVDAILASRERPKISRGSGRTKLSVEEYVAHWLKKLGLIESFRVDPIIEGGNLYQVWVRRTSRAPEVLIPDVGFGVSQILPVLTICYYAPRDSIIVLEQPEIHLHPSVQAGLADLFIDACNVRNVQIILESHSEHLLRRLQRRIAEDTITTEDVSLYFCSSASGRSKLSELDMDLFGNISNWPENFFGDEVGEITSMMAAQISKAQNASDD